MKNTTYHKTLELSNHLRSLEITKDMHSQTRAGLYMTLAFFALVEISSIFALKYCTSFALVALWVLAVGWIWVAMMRNYSDIRETNQRHLKTCLALEKKIDQLRKELA